ncbi:hypothetical protein [Streptomyces sp. S1A1-7]|uniref:hypothetical protein n=1 Tax=Streptomyces sp. S1A1-7 TaxID=2594459 RepID=UPI001F086065|nr:hypothetical protein [Streptomyces sp. S1A1-7]
MPPEHALLVIDMKGYSQIPEAKMAQVRSDLDDILATVLAQSELEQPRERDGAYKDTGDGAIFVFPARDTGRLVDPLLGYLNAALCRYDRERLASSPAIRLRASVHSGPLSLPDHRGDAINEACRLIDSQAARQAMAAAADHGAFLAAVLSDIAYRRTVHAGRTPALDEHHFLRTTARVDGKPGFERPCRLLVPSVSPAAVSPYLVGAGNSTPPSLPGSVPQEHAEAQEACERQDTVQQKAKASGRAQVIQVGGNYSTGPKERS